MFTDPEEPVSAGMSQEHLPWVHGTDQSFTASARWPAASTRVSNAAENLMEEGICVKESIERKERRVAKGTKSRDL
jgi:hypothetical protein